MPYLLRMNIGPEIHNLPPKEMEQLKRIFDTHAGEVRVYDESIGWDEIEEVELVQAPTVSGPAGWLLSRFMNTENRYHVGLYMRREEAVLPNVTRRQALYILHAVAYFAPNKVRYKGPEGVVPVMGA